jgi:phage-related minor tail protein
MLAVSYTPSANSARAVSVNTTDIDTIANNVLDIANGVETSLTLRQAIRLIVSASAGKLSGASTATITIRNIGDSKNRIVATVDAYGNRSAITTDLT